MRKPFELRKILRDKDALMPRLELALALERRPQVVPPTPPMPPLKGDEPKR